MYRRILFRAAAVIALGLMALSAPRPAQAAPLDCPDICVQGTTCPANGEATACLEQCGTSHVCACFTNGGCGVGQVEVECGLC
jgi:hypothetical protein